MLSCSKNAIMWLIYHNVRRWGLATYSVFPIRTFIHASIRTSDCPSQNMSTLVNATPPTILAGSFLKLAGLKMYMRFGCISQTIFVTFLQFELSKVFSELLPCI